ncbi:PE-PPE domain-containing protein [Rhodococcus triatomae]|uniref:PE-PPE domain-containing protein n=1 Tax=Rhodococcus triatomae TaxID=300028 RepID=A0A1G7ZIE2_9NOCA|nr:PE-PPE domain-containing protein [Rhodococcus triatomae]QNG18034.1 PE-PPE domain-containing protein [Rhodococcus triatomae]QNG22295.1 PE-PPE domain-containing protein [Rhodococcus triatomae]SDH08326.1 PE-PPE domain-containing protein [Rhodococcus triatomae]
MAEVTVLAVGGTGESYPDDDRLEVSGILRGVVDALDPRFDARWVGYPASYGPVSPSGLSYRDSVDAGVERLVARIEASSTPVLPIGYSQGCTVVREVLGRIADGRLPRGPVVAAGLISDPHQPADVVRGCSGSGVAGAGPPTPDTVPVLWVAHPRDMICNAGDDSLIRDVADLTASMSLRTTHTWRRDIWALLRSNGFQNAPKTRVHPAQWRTDLRRVRAAAEEVLGYLPRRVDWHGVRITNRRGGRHVAYATEPLDTSGLTGCQILAQWLQVQATFRPRGRERTYRTTLPSGGPASRSTSGCPAR